MKLAALVHQLRSVCCSDQAAAQEAWWLLEALTGASKTVLLTQSTIILTHEQEQKLGDWLKQRIDDKKPLQYIIGSVPFCGVDIILKPPILIPRPETEEWVSWLIEQLQSAKNESLTILDLCTGTGCIALALAHALPKARVVGIDINPAAVELALSNQRHNGLANVTFMQSDLFTVFGDDQTFDLIVSNPPYVTKAEYGVLDPSVRDWEDRNALVAEQQGLAFYEHIASHAHQYLRVDSILNARSLSRMVVELGTNHHAVEKIFQEHGFVVSGAHKDLQSMVRWLALRI